MFNHYLILIELYFLERTILFSQKESFCLEEFFNSQDVGGILFIKKGKYF